MWSRDCLFPKRILVSTSLPDESLHTNSSAHPAHDETPSAPSIVGLLTTLLQGRRVIVVTSLLAAVVAGTFKLLSPATYTSTAALIPQDRPAAGNLAGIAAQLGVNVPGGELTQSPAFYADLLTSRPLLEAVVDTRYSATMPDGTPATSLEQVYKASGATPELRRENTITRLRRDLSVTVIQKTGVVRLQVVARSPTLAQQIAARELDLLNRFNLETRQSRAGAERTFTEQRVKEVRDELRAAEDALQQFLQTNREFRNSPQLTFRQERLAREVTMRQQVYQSLAQAYEQARIDAVRDTPVITVVEKPEVPIRRDSRGTVGAAIIAFIAVGLVTSLIVVMRGEMRGDGNQSSERARLLEELRETWGDVRRPWRLVVRRRQP